MESLKPERLYNCIETGVQKLQRIKHFLLPFVTQLCRNKATHVALSVVSDRLDLQTIVRIKAHGLMREKKETVRLREKGISQQTGCEIGK